MNLNLSGERIKEMRKKAGLTQDQLAAKLSGIETTRGKSTISEYEHGKNLTLNNLQRMADVLECDVDYLLGCIKHPDITTSWIAENVPLSREAIESLKYLKQTGSYNSIMAIALLNSIIVGMTDSVKASGNGQETIFSDIFQMDAIFEQIADYEATGSDFNPDPKLNGWTRNISLTAITGLSFKIGNYLAEIVKGSIRTLADPKKHIQSEV